MKLQRRVLVTGVSSQLGRSVAEKFLAIGSFVIGTSRSLGQVANLEKYAAERDGRFEFIPCDLTSEGEVDDLAATIGSLTSHLDSIIHIAGGTGSNGPFSAITSQEWIKTYDLNVISLQRILTRLLPELLAGNEPSIVAVGSATAEEPGAWDPHYSAAKAALLNFTKHLAGELSRDGIRVNYVALGPTNSGHWGIETEQIQNKKDELSRRIPLGRLGKTAEVAELIIAVDSSFLWMTGSRIRFDGGKNKSI